MQADVEFPTPHAMLLRHGWKTFARAHSLAEGHIVHCKLMEATLLSIKVFGRSGARLGYSAERSTDDGSSTSSDNDEEDSDGEDNSTEWQDGGSDSS